jgi:hypothetical protein
VVHLDELIWTLRQLLLAIDFVDLVGVVRALSIVVPGIFVD